MHCLTVYRNNLSSNYLNTETQLPKRIYLTYWERALLKKEEMESWKMHLSKPNTWNTTMAKAYFPALTIAQSCLMSLSQSVSGFVQFDCGDIRLSSAWPDYLVAWLNKMKKAFSHLLLRDARLTRNTTESIRRAMKSLVHLMWIGFDASQHFFISQQQLPPVWVSFVGKGPELRMRSWATCDTGKRMEWDRDREGMDYLSIFANVAFDGDRQQLGEDQVLSSCLDYIGIWN